PRRGHASGGHGSVVAEIADVESRATRAADVARVRRCVRMMACAVGGIADVGRAEVVVAAIDRAGATARAAHAAVAGRARIAVVARNRAVAANTVSVRPAELVGARVRIVAARQPARRTDSAKASLTDSAGKAV